MSQETTVKITVTNGELIAMRPPLQQINSHKFPVKTTYALVKLSLKVQAALVAIEETRKALVKKFGIEDARGNFSVPATVKQHDDANNTDREVPNPAWEEFSREYTELLEQTQELEFAGKVRLPENVAATCDACHHNMDRPLEIEPGIIIALEKFIEVE